MVDDWRSPAARKRLSMTSAVIASRDCNIFLIGGDGHDLNGTLDLLEQFFTEVAAKCD